MVEMRSSFKRFKREAVGSEQRRGEKRGVIRRRTLADKYHWEIPMFVLAL